MSVCAHVPMLKAVFNLRTTIVPENAPGSMAPKYQRAPKRPRSIRIPNRKKRLHLDLVAIFLRLQTLGEVTVVFFLLDPQENENAKHATGEWRRCEYVGKSGGGVAVWGKMRKV